MDYTDALTTISQLSSRGWRMGLDRMLEFVRRAGLERALGEGFGGPRYVHVAGTNGKGSVTAYLQSLMVESGFRTGAYYSPYVYDPRERVQFGRDLIPERDLVRGVEALLPVARTFDESEFGGISEFEFKTALGFWYWLDRQAEWVALEVGLGGRLDATNVVNAAAGVIVSIGYDHVAFLGDTHAKIAREKAGIIKPGMTTIVGALSADAMESVRQVASIQGAPLIQLGSEIQVRLDEHGCLVRTPQGEFADICPGIQGAWQAENAALALAAWEVAQGPIEPELARRAIAAATLPGRFERRDWNGKVVILDGAHNAEAGAALRESLDRFYPDARIALVTGMVGGHDPRSFYAQLADCVDWAGFVPINFHRAVAPSELVKSVRDLLPMAQTVEDVASGLQAASEASDLILVTGSFYLLGEVVQEL